VMKYLSVCSGIEAAHAMGFTPVAFAEIEPFASRVLAHHYPDVPNWGDINGYATWPDAAFDVLVGGTPCQSFSVAGLRKGLADPRGNLTLVFLGIAARYRPEWVVWENVPGVLSVHGGRAFGAFLGGLAELGYGFAYRVLDAQYFSVAQRRRRVFVVGHLGDWRRAAAVLFERESLCGDSPPSREAGEGVAGAVTRRVDRGGVNSEGGDGPLIAHALRRRMNASHRADSDTCVPTTANSLNARDGKGADPGRSVSTVIAHSLRADGFDASEDGTGRGTPIVFDWQSGGDSHGLDPQPTAQLQSCQVPAVMTSVVRRLTPVECERLQGFPDGYTAIPKAADGPRYKALGNSMAVPVMAWIGKRILALRGA
jgi:DNA (cytosine-5)-methyltransferase 1